MDLGRGLPESIKIKVDEWTHIQRLDYEQIPFKCKLCHEYGHFANRCTRKKENESEKTEDLENKWGQVKKKKTANKHPNHSSSQPSTSTEAQPISPNVDLATANPFNPLDFSAPPSPHSKSRSRSPHSPNPSPHSPRISNPHLSPPPSEDKILTRKQAKEALPNIENKNKKWEGRQTRN